MNDITVIHHDGDAFAVLVRDHVVHVDQPYSAGGMDEGPTPVELFVASLAACAAHHGRRYLAERGLPAEGLEVTAGFTLGGPPARVAGIELAVRPPTRLSDHHVHGLLAAIDRCTVHNSIVRPPRIEIDVHAEAEAA